MPRSTPRPARLRPRAPHAGGRAGGEPAEPDQPGGRAQAPQSGARRSATPSPSTLPPLEYGRIAAQSAKQVIVQKVREAERDRQYEEYKDRIGDIVNGIVKRVEYGNVVVDLGRGEAIVRRDEMLPRETLRNGDRIRAFIYDVRREARGPADLPLAHASAVHGEAVRAGGAGNLRRHRRGEGGRPRSRLARQDRGDLARFLGRSGRRLRRHARLARAGGGATSCRARRSTSSRGRRTSRPSWSTRWRPPKSPRSCSTRTASASRWWCRISSFRSRSAGAARTCGSPRSSPAGTSTSSPSRRSPSAARPSSRSAPRLFMDALNVDEVVGQLLASEGFTSVEELACVDEKEIAGIEGFDEDTARELQTRARDYLAQDRGRARRQAQGARRRGCAQGGAGRHHGDAGRARRERRQDGGGSGRLRDRRPRRLDRAQGRRDQARARLPRRLRAFARGDARR